MPQPGEVAQEDHGGGRGSFNRKGTENPSAFDDISDEQELEVDASYFPTDRYKALSQIGHGAAGNVYLCRDRLLGTKLAVKCLRHISGEQLIAFQQEAKATSSLSHQNIVKIYNFGVTDSGAPYMVMEYVEGISLEQFIRQFGPLSAENALGLTEVIAGALSYAHSKRIFHRDIKSSNILLADYTPNSDGKRADGSQATIESRSVRLIDFGVAMVKHANQEPTIVQGQTVVGTPAYMPPDQAQGMTYDERSEIYALGCTLFEALVGSTPFAGDTALEIISKHASEEPPKVSSIVALAEAQAVDELVAKCLAKEQSQRFQTMQEFRDECRAILSQVDSDREFDSDGSDTTGGSPLESNNVPTTAYSGRQNAAIRKKHGTKLSIGIAVFAGVVALVPVIQWASAPSSFVAHDSQISVPAISIMSKAFDNRREERAKVVRGLIANGKKGGSVNMDEYLSAYSWDDVDLKPFVNCKSIDSLDLSNNVGISEKGMRYLDNVPLCQLNLTNTNVHDLTQLPHCEETLKTLKLGQNKSSHRSLQSLIRFKNLSRLVFADSSVTPDDIRFLADHLPLIDTTIFNCSFVKKEDVEAMQKEYPYFRFNYQGETNPAILERVASVSKKLNEQKRYAERLRLWQEWERKAPQYKDRYKRILARSLALQSDCYSLLHNKRKAEETMQRALAIVGKYGDSLEKLLIVDLAFTHYYENKQDDKAIELGLKSQALQTGTLSRQIQNERQESKLAHLLVKKGRYEDAIRCLVDANSVLSGHLNQVQNLEKLPEQTAERNLLIDNLNALAVCYEKTGKHVMARDCMAKREIEIKTGEQLAKQKGQLKLAPDTIPTDESGIKPMATNLIIKGLDNASKEHGGALEETTGADGTFKRNKIEVQFDELK